MHSALPYSWLVVAAGKLSAVAESVVAVAIGDYENALTALTVHSPYL